MNVDKCATCSKDNAPSVCSRCQYAHYCGVKCQRKHWKKHKKECKIWAKSVTQQKENETTKAIMTNRRLGLLMGAYFRDACLPDPITYIQHIIKAYVRAGFRKNGQCKAVLIEIIELFACLIGDELMDFDIDNFQNVFEEATVAMMDGMTLKTFKTRYFDPFYAQQSEEETFPSRYQNQQQQQLREWKAFLNTAAYGDVLICTSAWNNHGYNDLDFVVGLNTNAEFTFYRYSVDNGIGFISDGTEIVNEMKHTAPKGYYVNYYQKIYALFPMFEEYLKNRSGEWIEIGLIEQAFQRYFNLSHKETLIILKMVGFPPDDYQTNLYFDRGAAQRQRMAQQMAAQMGMNGT